MGWGGRGGRAGGGEAPRCPSLVPRCCSPVAAGGGLTVSVPGGHLSTRGGSALPSRSPSTHRVLGCCAGPHPWASRSSRCCGLAAWHRRGGGGPGQRLVVSGLCFSWVPASRASACSWLALPLEEPAAAAAPAPTQAAGRLTAASGGNGPGRRARGDGRGPAARDTPLAALGPPTQRAPPPTPPPLAQRQNARRTR